ncbi:MAG: hypothetical protein ACYC2O_08805 [Microthrixaceae bacterium]
MSEEGSVHSGEQPASPAPPSPSAAPPPTPPWVDAMWAPPSQWGHSALEGSPPSRGPIPEAPVPVAPRRSRRSLLWAALALGAMLCLAGAGVSYWWTQRGPQHPDEWDPRVADLVAFVEGERGAPFEHPVTVDFLDPDEYAAATAAPAEEPDEDTIALADDQVAMFRALGLMTGEVDLLDSSQELFGSSTAAFYDPITGQVYVNATADDALSTSTAATVVHELTHVHQDQITGLGDALVDVEEETTTDQQDAHLAIVEGDAMVVEQAYIAALPQEEIDAYAEEWGTIVDDAEAAVDAAEVPAALDLLFEVPYALGPGYVAYADARGDRALVEAAIGGDVPPSVVVLDLVTGDPPAVEQPDAPAHDGEELDLDTFGAMSWLVVLGGASAPDQALTAASTWRGDRVVQYLDDRDRRCLAATVVVSPELHGAPVDGSSTFESAARRWAASLPGESDASVEATGDEVRLRSCDPGAGVEVAAASSEGSADAVEFASLTNTITAQVVAGGGEPEGARCYAHGMLDRFGPDRLADDVDLFDSAEFSGAATELALACRVGG